MDRVTEKDRSIDEMNDAEAVCAKKADPFDCIASAVCCWKMPQRPGYTEIGAASSESLNASNGSSGNKDRSTPFLRYLAAGATLATICAVAYSLSPSFAGKEQVIVIEEHPPQDPLPSVEYRPFCETHGRLKTNFQIIQTSINEPSRQWAPQPCVPAEQRHVTLNTALAPDARILLNFSHTPFNHSILGFGGAFTESSALNFQRLSVRAKDQVMELLFGKSGLGYALGRVPINSCDFSVKSYSFDDTEDDFELQDFDMQVSHNVNNGMVDMALRAASKLKHAWGIDLKLMASPWSPPSWMKRPTKEDSRHAIHAEKMTYSKEPNCLRDGVDSHSKYAAAWALYFSKFLTAYERWGLPFWSVTVQNEPEFAAPWEACAYTAEVQRQFVANHLGPRLEQDHPDVKLLIFDHNKDHVNEWVEDLMNSSSHAAQFVDGTAYHWYAGGIDRLLDGALGTPNMHRLQERLKHLGIENDHIVVGSESCHCPTTSYAGGSKEISWARAERYAHTILADLAAGSHGWMEWNLILDGIGGPNHLGNLCETSLLAVPHRAVDATFDAAPLPDFELQLPMGNASMGDGRTREELNALGYPAQYLDMGIAVQPIYFYMGHISRFIRPGSTTVMALVHPASGDNGQIFMPQGQSVPGGGINDLARNGIELTVWPCEGSTRQQFKWDDVTRHIKVYGHNWLGDPTVSCVAGSVDPDFHGLRLVDCDDGAGRFGFRNLGNSTFQVLLESGLRTRIDHCLVIEKLKNGGGAYGPTGGAQVTLGHCSDKSAEWIINPSTGEAASLYFKNEKSENRVCMTTGWPFLQVGAFLTPDGDAPQTVVLLNEASQSANYALQDEHEVLVTGMIPPRSIQTITIS